MNIHNFAQKTNWTASSDQFTNVPFFLTSVSIPGINFSNPEVGGRGSSRMKLPGDAITFNTLAFEMLIDEDFEIFTEMMSIINKQISVETGTFGDFYFDFWIELNNNKGNKVLKLEFVNCRLESIGDIILDTQDESSEHKLFVKLTYDYYKFADTLNLTLSTQTAQ